MSYSTMTWDYLPAADSNYAIGRLGYAISKITVHHMAGKLTAAECANIFADSTRIASSNYGIGYDGSIACYVDEENRAYTSNSRSNDAQAITIEVSDDMYEEPWLISDAAWNALVGLCVDICKRYNFKLIYDGTPNGSLTRHDMFANTDCPGTTLGSRFPELAQTVNRILEEQEAPKDIPLNTYCGHVQDIGWLPPVSFGKECGSTGIAKRLEAIIINNPDIQYRVHIQDIGWTQWYKAKQMAGTTGEAKRIEAINFKSTKKIKAQGHVENIGWQKEQVGTNITIGTTGQSLRLEAFKLNFSN